MVLFRDEIGQFPPGQLFYPESLKFVAGSLAEFSREEIGHPKYFNANVQALLDNIIGYFDAIHETHDAAIAIYQQYRSAGRQYCLYLRSFLSSGLSLYRNLERNLHTFGWVPEDRNLKRLIKQTLGGNTNCLTFLNTHEFLSPMDQAGPGAEEWHIPSFRLLSHNWRENVIEVIKGAKLIVLDLRYETEGVMSEVDLVRECAMAQRTICLVENNTQDKPTKPLSDFREVIVLPSLALRAIETAELDRLKNMIGNLANDAFKQRHRVRGLSDLKCYVIDKHVELAASQFSPEIIAGLNYEDYLPSSLSSNWALLVEFFPKLLERWGLVEGMIEKARMEVDTVAEVMYEALQTFRVAVTLERYKEMAFAICRVGWAHWLITGQTDIKTDCCRHAAKCATWHGDFLLAEQYRNFATLV